MSEVKQEVIFRRSKRVTLRPVLEQDVPLLLKWINDPEVSKYLKVHLPMMEADENEWFTSMHKRKPRDMVVAIVVDDKPIGTMGLHGIDHRQGHATTGALIGEKDCWDKGYGSEAKMLLLEFAFNVLNLRKVYSNVIAFNERSHAYSLKCGYKEEGRLKDHHYAQGKYWDQIWLSVYRNDWELLWETFRKEHEGFLMV
ncbi:MAG: GNAT family N-acetyltransferase [Candidatus Pacebacteria bacterium]|nr:GNAT family N-acetyltransferase [Candidatus Paceibacterota bacterium]MCF7857094.1 GNAT family N-acetyltransferase [Candidatus Paceibacterota bacterium]